MLEGLLHIFARRPISQVAIDLLDVFVVAVLIYRGLLIVRGTRAVQMGLGVALIFLTYLAAQWIGLATLQNLFSSLLSSAILIIIVVFQNDIRRALMRIGTNPLFGAWGRAFETQVIDEVVAATTELARHRIGAIITFEQDANLAEFVVGQGTPIDAAVSRTLLTALFIPEQHNKLHDGAVIIRDLRIAKAGVFFPMPEARNVDPRYGSRHRAAIGITEETDAVVVVVSEERGSISLCFNGNIVTDLDGEVLRKTLLRIFGRPQRKKDKKSIFARKRVLTPPAKSRVTIATPPPPQTAITGPLRTVRINPPQPRPVDTPTEHIPRSQGNRS